MSACPGFSAQGSAGIADALRSVDCMSGRATAAAFARLFGADGQLGTALTALLTLFVGWIAVGLLTGRSRLSLAGLTPRVMSLGLALTFATSWAAYQSVIWNLATGAPDEIAGLLIGSKGSATMLFAGRLDMIFAAIADAATAAQAAASDKSSMATPADVLWLGALLLLLGTVGVLLVSRIALAALLALGPIFILLALFAGTRGLFEGWLKGVAMFALVPLFAVLIGGGALAMLAPVVTGLGMAGELTMRAAVTVFLAATVYVALMVIVLKVTMVLTAGWRLPGHRAENDAAVPPVIPQQASARTPLTPAAAPRLGLIEGQDRVRTIVSGLGAANEDGATRAATDRIRLLVTSTNQASPAAAINGSDDRARGLGNRYRSAPPPLSPEKLS